MHGILRTLNSSVIDGGLLTYKGILPKVKQANLTTTKIIVMSNYKKPQYTGGPFTLKSFPNVSKPDPMEPDHRSVCPSTSHIFPHASGFTVTEVDHSLLM